MKLSNDARLPQGNDLVGWRKRIYELVRDIVNQLNAMSDGSISACANAAPAAPTTGTYTPGDFVRNSAPAELGPAGAKYVIEGWMCVSAPATFVQKRFFTGN